MSKNNETNPAPPAQPKSRRALLINLSLSAASLLVFVALLELAFRLLGYGNVEIYQADPQLYWKLKPNQHCYTKVDHRPVNINAHGTRGPDFQTAKPPGTLRILSLGDSRTFGWGLAEPETYSGVLESLVRQHFAGQRNVEVINAGVNAWSFPQMTVYFREHGLKYQPDVVLVGDANLWTQFSEQNSPDFVRKFMRRVQLKNFLRRFALYHYFVEVKLKEVYEKYRVKFVPVDPGQDKLFQEQQQKDPDAFFRDAIDQLCTLALSNRVKPVLVYFPTQDEANRPRQRNLREAKAGIAQKLHIPFVDLTPDLPATGEPLYLDADPIHFNVKGNQIIGTRLFQTVTNLLSP
ncbi:MAG: SGNH/GDSL hydrolase family protein [Verrucomicrobiota bacterium]